MPPRRRATKHVPETTVPDDPQIEQEMRPRNPSEKQQQLNNDKVSCHHKAVMNAVRAEQRHEELAGFSRRKGPNPVEDTNDNDLESEDDFTDQNTNSAFTVEEVSIPPRNPQLRRRAPPATNPGPPASNAVPLARNPNLVPRTTAIPPGMTMTTWHQNKIRANLESSMNPVNAPENVVKHSDAAGPYTPPVQYFYGTPNGSFYSPDVHDDNSVYVSDDEFGTHCPPNMYPKPKKIFYPNAHPDLREFQSFKSVTTSDALDKEGVPSSELTKSSSLLGVRKIAPTTVSSETTRVLKSTKVASGGTRGRARASDFDELTKAVLEDAITLYKGKLFTSGAFLDRTAEYDLAVESFVLVCKARKIQMEIDDDLMKLITNRSSQARGECKSKAHPLVAPAFGINAERPAREIRNLVEDLLDRMNFLYKDPSARSGLFQNPIISTVINTTWFKNKNDEGANNPNFLKDGIPLPSIALVFTVIECCLDEWQTGEHVDVQFTAASYAEKYEGHLKTLLDLDKRTKDIGIIQKLRLSLAKKAHKNAKILDRPAARKVELNDADLEAAKKDWEGFDDSEDEPVDSTGTKDTCREQPDAEAENWE